MAQNKGSTLVATSAMMESLGAGTSSSEQNAAASLIDDNIRNTVASTGG